MLTVKHICPMGHETIVTADSVTFNPDQPALYVHGASPSAASVAGQTDFYDGTVYVMNDAGATVAKYRLPVSPVPERGYVSGVFDKDARFGTGAPFEPMKFEPGAVQTLKF